MNPTFLSALRSHGGPGTALRTASGTIPAHVRPPPDSLSPGTSVQVRVASAEASGGIRAFFGNLFGSKRENPSVNLRESSLTQPVEARSRAVPLEPSAAPAQTKASITTQGEPSDSKQVATTEPQVSPPQKPSAELLPDTGGPRTTNLLIGAVPTVPAGGFQKN